MRIKFTFENWVAVRLLKIHSNEEVDMEDLTLNAGDLKLRRD